MPIEPADPRLGAAIRRLREAAEMSQEQLAYAAGISVGALGRLERSAANPTWTTVVRIIGVLDIDLAQLGDELGGASS